jgi:hypothetical protein
MSDERAREAGAIVSDEGLPELQAEISRLANEVAALERLAQDRSTGPEARQRTYERLLGVEAQLERVVAQVRELHRQMTLIESWRR